MKGYNSYRSLKSSRGSSAYQEEVEVALDSEQIHHLRLDSTLSVQSPLVEEKSSVEFARLASSYPENLVEERPQSDESEEMTGRTNNGWDEFEVSGAAGDLLPTGSVVPASDNEAESSLVPLSDKNLPETVTLLSLDNGTQVFIVGTAHFSKESQDDVRNVSGIESKSASFQIQDIFASCAI